MSCFSGFYMDDTFNCYECQEACALCFEDSDKDCTACNEGYFLFPKSTICVDYCPTGIAAENEVCDDSNPLTSCFTFDNKDLVKTINDATVVLPEDEDAAPRPVYNRGIYFDGYDSMQITNLVLNVQFSLSYWIRTETTFGFLFEVVDHLRFSLINGALYYEYNVFVHTKGQIVVDTWQSVAISVSSDNDVQLYIDNIWAGERANQGETFIDSPDYEHTVGTGYFGFIFEICIYSRPVINFPLDKPSQCGADLCDSCPDGVCIYDCSIDEYWDTLCRPCLPECDDCRRAFDCRDCDDLLCEECDVVETCNVPNGCIANASFNDQGQCSCDLPLIYLTEDGVCGQCIDQCSSCVNARDCDQCDDKYYLMEDLQCATCHEYCALCTGPALWECTQCVDGKFFWPHDNACQLICPTGFESNNGICESAEVHMCFTFDDKPLPLTALDAIVDYCEQDQPETQPIPAY